MTVRGAREKMPTEIKVWGEELSTSCLNSTADSSLKTSARGTAASQASNKVCGYSVDKTVDKAENILHLYHSMLNSHLACCPCPSASSKRSCRNEWRSESKSENKWVGTGGRGRTMAGRAWKDWGLSQKGDGKEGTQQGKIPNTPGEDVSDPSLYLAV